MAEFLLPGGDRPWWACDTLLEAKFEQIMVDAIVRAETLDPDIDPDAFLRGLRVMQNKLEERVQDARGEAGLEIFD